MANKKVNPKNEKFDFSDSVKAIREAAKTVNTQVREMTSEIVEDLKENGEQLRDRATAPVKEAYDKAYNRVTETVNREKIAKAAKDVNEYALKTATEVVDGAIENSEKWQGVATKAVKGGLKLAAKQQDIVFNTLETVKGQLSESASRFKKLFSNN
ncbi:MAG: hypothetical protein HRU41_00680 [Saprospiraceae bacterium]|nr:hypothetical protein [Saprospiraceae bacterium]